MTTRIVPSNRFRRRFPTQHFGEWSLEEYEVVSNDLKAWIQNTSWKVINAFLKKQSATDKKRTARILWLNNTICISAHAYPFRGKVSLQESIKQQHEQQHDVWNEAILEAQFKPQKEYSFHANVVGFQPFQQLVSFPTSLQRLFEIRLNTVSLNDAECGALAQFGGSLVLYNCNFSQGGVSLADGLRKDGHGPTDLKFLGRFPFNRKGYGAFCRALQVNTSLRALSFWKCTPRGGDDWTNLLIAIRGNRGLSDLRLVNVSLTSRQWGLLCCALANHPTIESLNLVCFPGGERGQKEKNFVVQDKDGIAVQHKDGMQRLHALAEALVRNQVIMLVNISLQQGQRGNQTELPRNQNKKLVIARQKPGSPSFTLTTKWGTITRRAQMGGPLPRRP